MNTISSDTLEKAEVRTRSPSARSIKEFWKRVDKSDGCWEYKGKVDSHNGYKRIKSGGRRTTAHRLSWEIHFGPVPDGLLVLHRCDNRQCCNPGHLFLGTYKDNAEDRDAKGRQTWGPEYSERARGENSNRAVLTERDVLSIRAEYATGAMTSRELAKKYGVGKTTITNVCARKTWTHI